MAQHIQCRRYLDRLADQDPGDEWAGALAFGRGFLEGLFADYDLRSGLAHLDSAYTSFLRFGAVAAYPVLDQLLSAICWGVLPEDGFDGCADRAIAAARLGGAAALEAYAHCLCAAHDVLTGASGKCGPALDLLDEIRRLGDHWDALSAAPAVALACEHVGNVQGAAAVAAEQIRQQRANGSEALLSAALRIAARLSVTRGLHETALRMWGATDEYDRRTGFRPIVVLAELEAALRRTAAERTGPISAEQLVTEGQGWSLLHLLDVAEAVLDEIAS